DLDEERKFIAGLDAGLKHAMQGGQYDAAGMWLHTKLMSTSEESQQVDRTAIIEELSSVAKFINVAKGQGGRAVSW
ncbi:unnamed protein product, partial [Ectocarpus fasciculatus]